VGMVKEDSLEAPLAREESPGKEGEKVTLVSGRLEITAHRLSPLRLENASVEQLDEMVWVLRMPEASGKTMLARLIYSSQSPVDYGLDVESNYEITLKVGNLTATTNIRKTQRAGKLLGRIYALRRDAVVENPVYDLLVYAIPTPVFRDLLSATVRQGPWGKAIEVHVGEDKTETRAIVIKELLESSVERLKKAFEEERDRKASKVGGGDVVKLKRELAGIEKDIEETEAKIKRLEEELRKADEALKLSEEEKEEREALDKFNDYRAKKAKYESMYSSAKKLREEIAALEEEVGQLQLEFTSATAGRPLESLQEDARQQDERLSRLKEARRLMEELYAKLSAVPSYSMIIAEAAQYVFEDPTGEVAAITDAVSVLREKIGQLKDYGMRELEKVWIEESRKAHQELSSLQRLHDYLKAKNDDLENKKAELNKLEQELAGTHNMLVMLRQRVSWFLESRLGRKVDPDSKEAEEFFAAIDRRLASEHEAMAKRNRIREEIGKLTEQLNALRVRKAEIEERISRLESVEARKALEEAAALDRAVKYIGESVRDACGVAQEFFKEFSDELASMGRTSILAVRNCRILIREDIAFDPPRDPAQLSESEKAIVSLVLQVAAAYFLGKLMADQSIIENRRKFLAVADITAIHDPKMLLAVYNAIRKIVNKHRAVFQNAVEGFILMHHPSHRL